MSPTSTHNYNGDFLVWVKTRGLTKKQEGTNSEIHPL